MGLRVKRYGPLSTMVVVGRLVGTFEPALVIVTMAHANNVSATPNTIAPSQRTAKPAGRNRKGASQSSASPAMTANPHASGGRTMARIHDQQLIARNDIVQPAVLGNDTFGFGGESKNLDGRRKPRTNRKIPSTVDDALDAIRVHALPEPYPLIESQWRKRRLVARAASTERRRAICARLPGRRNYPLRLRSPLHQGVQQQKPDQKKRGAERQRPDRQSEIGGQEFDPGIPVRISE